MAVVAGTLVLVSYTPGSDSMELFRENATGHNVEWLVTWITINEIRW